MLLEGSHGCRSAVESCGWLACLLDGAIGCLLASQLTPHNVSPVAGLQLKTLRWTALEKRVGFLLAVPVAKPADACVTCVRGARIMVFVLCQRSCELAQGSVTVSWEVISKFCPCRRRGWDIHVIAVVALLSLSLSWLHHLCRDFDHYCC